MDTDPTSKISIQGIVYEFLKKNKLYLVYYFILSLATPIVNIYIPSLYGEIINELKEGKKLKDIHTLLYKTIFFWIVAQFLYSLMDVLDKIFLPKLTKYVRMRLVSLIIQDSKCNMRDIPIGDILSKILKVPTIVKELFHQSRYMFLPTFVTIVFSLGYFYYVNTNLGMVGTFMIVALTLFLFVLSKQSIHMSQKVDNEHTQLHEEISDILTNLPSVLASGMIHKELEYIDKFESEYNHCLQKTISKSSKFKLFFNMSYILLILSIVGYSIRLQSTDAISTGTLVSVLFVVVYLINQISMVAGEIRDFVFNVGVIKKTNLFLNQLVMCEKDTFYDEKDSRVQTGKIVFNDLQIKYDNRVIIDNFSYSIHDKDKVCIYGPIGTGKTTLIKSLLRFKPISNGSIWIDNKNIIDYPIDLLRKNIGYIPQDIKLLNRSIFDNIVYGTQKTKQDVYDAIEKYKIHQLSNIDLDKKAGKYGNNLSGGQKQIVLLLRCLLQDTKIIILDEPTSNLDIYSVEDILRILDAVDKTLIIITHDENLYKVCNKFIFSGHFTS